MGSGGRAYGNISWLIAAQMLVQTAGIALVATSSLVAFAIAPAKSLATLPIALSVLSSAAMMIPASLYMQTHGRRRGFMIGAASGLCSGLVIAAAIWQRSFALFIAGHVLAGIYQAFAQYYRFAAVESAGAVHAARVIAWVISGGIIAAFAGPALARAGNSGAESGGLDAYIYLYLALALLALLALLLLMRLQMPPVARRPAADVPARTLAELLRQPAFVTAIAASTAGYAVMSMIMSGTPLAMQLCGLPLTASASVIRWHMLGMFVPSLFTGDLIRRFGVHAMMTTGALLIGAQIVVALNGISYAHFVVGLALLGAGWNFLFIGGSTLLARVWRPGEQARVQSTHDFTVFGVASIGSWAAGQLLVAAGWNTVNWVAVPLLLVALVLVLLHWRQEYGAALQ